MQNIPTSHMYLFQGSTCCSLFVTTLETSLALPALIYFLCLDICFKTCRSLRFMSISPFLQFRESWSTDSEAVGWQEAVEWQEKNLHQYDHNLIPCYNSAFTLSLIHAKEICSLILYFSYAPYTWHSIITTISLVLVDQKSNEATKPSLCNILL